MRETLVFLLGLAHIPVGGYLLFLCVRAQRQVTEGQKEAKKGLDLVMALAGAVIAMRLTQMSVPMTDLAKAGFWRSITTFGLLAFIPFIKALAKTKRSAAKT